MNAWCWNFWLRNWREPWCKRVAQLLKMQDEGASPVGTKEERINTENTEFAEKSGRSRSLRCAARRAKRRRGRRESGRSGRDDKIGWGAKKRHGGKSRVPLRGIGDCHDPSAAARKRRGPPVGMTNLCKLEDEQGKGR